MRSLATLVATLVIPTAALAADVTTTPHPGIKRIRRTTASQHINVLVVDLCAAGVSVRTTKSGEKQRTVSSFGALVGAQAAINGDFFNGSYGTNGPAMGDGAGWGGSDHNYVAPAQFGAHQVALPTHGSTSGVEPWAKQVVSGHPSLIVNGTKLDNNGDTLCSARHPRTALGFTADKKKLILAVVDGRATSRLGYTCAELGNLMAEFGATNAVNLDGGGSSAMWVGGTGVVNYPSDGSQRVVANHLAVRAKGTGDAPHCPAPKLTATFAGASHDTATTPIELRSGEESVVWLELENTGDATWNPASTRVGTQDAQDRESAFFKAENWVSRNRPTGADEAYAPGTTGRFTWAMVAPEVSETTTFDETFQLVEESVAWFGPKTTLSFTVHPTMGPTPDDEDETADDGTGGGGCSTGRGTRGWLVLALLALVRARRRTR